MTDKAGALTEGTIKLLKSLGREVDRIKNPPKLDRRRIDRRKGDRRERTYRNNECSRD